MTVADSQVRRTNIEIKAAAVRSRSKAQQVDDLAVWSEMSVDVDDDVDVSTHTDK